MNKRTEGKDRMPAVSALATTHFKMSYSSTVYLYRIIPLCQEKILSLLAVLKAPLA